MKYRCLGKSGLQLSELSFGAWVTFAQQISNETAEELMTIAYDNGANFFDNAEAYAEGRAEIVMGKQLTREGWEQLVSSMVDKGATGTDDEFNQIIDYLAANFPKAQGDGDKQDQK